jgi:hypothetical protein
METIKVRVKKENVPFLRRLLQELNFVTTIEIESTEAVSQEETHIDPIQWSKSSPSINDFAGIWKDRNISLDELREKA